MRMRSNYRQNTALKILKMIVYRVIRQREMTDFLAHDPSFAGAGPIAISQIRGASHAANPQAEAEDVLLLLAEEDGLLVGYLGALPNRLQGKVGEERFAWLSCLWIDPNMRGRGLAKSLLEQMYTAWSGRLMITEFTPAAKGLYDKSGYFQDLAQPKGLRLYLYSPLAKVLPKKDPKKWRPYLPLFNLLEQLSFGPQNMRMLFLAKGKYRCESDKNWRPEANKLLSEQKEGFLRGPKDFDWILNYPWLQEGPEDEAAKRYYFSSKAQSLDNGYLYFYEGQTLKAAVLYLLRDGHLRLPYVFMPQADASELIRALLFWMRQKRVIYLTTYQEQLVEALQAKKWPFLGSRPQARHYIITHPLAKTLGDQPFPIQDGDGDAAFT